MTNLDATIDKWHCSQEYIDVQQDRKIKKKTLPSCVMVSSLLIILTEYKYDGKSNAALDEAVH